MSTAASFRRDLTVDEVTPSPGMWWRIARRAAHPARQDALRGQLFHVYLMAYGAFQAAEERSRPPRLVP